MSIEIRRSNGGYELTASQFLPLPRETVFPFFADASNLERLTPRSLRFHILSPTPIEMKIGQTIEYRLRIRGLPIRWVSEITAWEPEHRFVDEQRTGPYRWWIHEHRFESVDGGTMVHDHVSYGVPGGALVHRLLVGPDIRRIFRFRRNALRDVFDIAATPE